MDLEEGMVHGFPDWIDWEDLEAGNGLLGVGCFSHEIYLGIGWQI